MKSIKIKHFSNISIFTTILVLILFKTFIYFLAKNEILVLNLGGGNDSNYYHNYAIGLDNLAVNIWPVILRYFNSISLYSRDAVSSLLYFISISLIPLMVCNLAGLTFRHNQKLYLYLLFLCQIYPTLYFYTWDIYRDVFMVFVFLLGCLIVKKTIYSKSIISFTFYFLISIIIGYFLISLRPYLGYTFLLSLFLWKVKLTKIRIYIFGLLYTISLFIAYSLGYLDKLIMYRSGFEEMGGGSTMGLDFTNPVLFIPNLILSTFGQLFGLYITNVLAIGLLIIETIPFTLMLIYIIKNIKLADSFLRFLIIFFFLYGSIWLIGNDNLGTAVRLRMYNYIAVYICFFYILRSKKNMVSS